MKEILVQFASYNYWANQQLAGILVKMSEEQADKDLGGSFPSLRQTILHLWHAEYIWHERLQLVERPVSPATDFNGTFTEACNNWLAASLRLKEWVQKATPAKLDHTIAYTRRKGENFKIEVQDLLMHVCNHSTFHRGQLVHMLRQLGVSKIPGTDYNSYKPKK